MKSKIYALLGMALCVTVASTAGASRGPQWSSYPGFTGPGKFGIVMADLNATGYRRIIASVQGYEFQSPALAVYDGPEGGLEVRQLIQFSPEASVYGELLVYRSPGSQRDLVGLSVGGEFVTYGDWPLRKLSAVPLPSPQTRVTSIYDLDGDGELELLGLTDPIQSGDIGSPFVAASADGGVIWNDTAMLVREIAAGHVGTRAEPVIVVSGSSGADPGLVLSGPTRETLWSWLDGFRGKIRFGNYAGDAAGEFALISTSGDTVIFRASPTFSPIFQFPTAEASARQSEDLDGDGYDEIIIGEGQWGSLKAYNTRTGVPMFTLNNPGHGVSAVAVGKVGSSNTLSLVHGTNLTLSWLDVLRVVDTADGDELQQWEQELGPHSASTLLRRADGTELVAFATVWSNPVANFDGSAIYLLDPETGAVVDSRLPSIESESRKQLKLRSANLDSDPQDELLVYSEDRDEGYVAVRDAESLDLQWQLEIPNGAAVQDAMAADVDGNDGLEIVLVAGRNVYFLNSSDGAILWTSDDFSGVGPSSLAFGPLLTSGELGVAYVLGDRLYVIDPINRVIDRETPLANQPMNQQVYRDGVRCEHRLYFANRVDQHHCSSGALEQTRDLASEATMVRMLGAFHEQILISDGRRLKIQAGDEIVKQSASIDVALGHDNQGVYSTAGEELRVFVGGDFGFHRVDFGPAIFTDGFEIK